MSGSYFLGESSFSVYEEMSRQLQRKGWKRRTESHLHQCDVILGDRFLIKYGQLRVNRLPQSSLFHGVQWVNYFQGSHKLTLKASMAEIIRVSDTTWKGWLPVSYVVGGGDPDKVLDERQEVLDTVSTDPDSIWIIKPSSGAKGESILLVRGVSDMVAFMESLKPSSKRRYVVQRYIDRPLLLSHQRKFDIRAWVLLKSPYDIYVYSQVSCRTASVAFDPSDLSNRLAHLTNHCVQEGAAEFGQHEVDNEMWLDALQSYVVTERHGPPLSAHVLPGMANIIVRTLLSMKPQMEVYDTEPFRCFQLFGYDFLVLDDYSVQLLEINGSPGIAQKFLGSVVRDMMDLLHEEPSAAAAANRSWAIDRDEFVLLWRDGVDPLPDGLSA